MSETETSEQVTESCQAIPNAARRGWRTDVLCASAANSEVVFCGRQVAVCRIHQRTYDRWGAAAEQQAIEFWEWQRDEPAE